MYSDKPVQQIYVNGRPRSNAFTIMFCLVITFFGGMGVMKVYSSPSTRAQIHEWIEDAKTGFHVMVRDFQADEPVLDAPDFPAPPEFGPEPNFEPAPPEHQRGDCQSEYQWVIVDVPYQNDCGKWSTQRIAKRIKL